jgi:CHASE3 domain sensor protein
MSDAASGINRQRKRSLSSVAEEFKRADRGLDRAVEKPFRTGASATQRKAKEDVARQKQTTALELAEADSEIAQRRARTRSKAAGRGSLIRSTGSGTATNLGGTA